MENLGRITLPLAFIFIGLYCYQLFIKIGSLLKRDIFYQCNCMLHINKLVWITQLIQEECLCWISTESYVKINTLCFNTSLRHISWPSCKRWFNALTSSLQITWSSANSSDDHSWSMELLLYYPSTINIDGTMVKIPYVRLFLRLSNFRFFFLISFKLQIIQYAVTVSFIIFMRNFLNRKKWKMQIKNVTNFTPFSQILCLI